MKYIANKFWEISQARDFYNTFSIRGHSESYRFHAVFLVFVPN